MTQMSNMVLNAEFIYPWTNMKARMTAWTILCHSQPSSLRLALAKDPVQTLSWKNIAETFQLPILSMAWNFFYQLSHSKAARIPLPLCLSWY